jgi:ribonuclease BN (tRNA processing enzyme)
MQNNQSINVYTREATKNVLLKKYNKLFDFQERIKVLNGNLLEELSDLKIYYCKLPHYGKGKDVNDTGEHIGFIFEAYGHRMSFMTDLGYLTDTMKIFHKDNHVYFIEANYDEELQKQSDRPNFLKQRITSNYGHLSNNQTAQYLQELTDPNSIKHVFLAHISQDCNHPELAKEIVTQKMKPFFSQYKDIQVYTDISKRYLIV